MRKIGWVILLMFWATSMYAQEVQPVKPNKPKKTPAQIEAEKRTKDSLQRVNQYNTFMSFVEDSLHYKTRDKEIQSNLDSIYNQCILPLNTAMQEVKSGSYNNTMSWVRILLFVLAFVMIVFLLVIIWLIKGLEDEIVSVVTDDNGNIKKWVKRITEKPSITPVQKSYDSEIRDLQKENRELKNRINELEDNIWALKNKPEARVIEQQTIPSKPVDSIKLLYSDSIIDGWFCHVWAQENDDTIFVLKLKSENHAIFTVFNQAYNKVLANASYLDGCDKQVLNSNTVDILSEGEAVREANGKWKVVSPLKVELR